MIILSTSEIAAEPLWRRFKMHHKGVSGQMEVRNHYRFSCRISMYFSKISDLNFVFLPSISSGDAQGNWCNTTVEVKMSEKSCTNGTTPGIHVKLVLVLSSVEIGFSP